VATRDFAPTIPGSFPGVALVGVVRNCLIEARPAVQGIFLMRFFAGAILAVEFSPIGVARAVLGAVAWWCATVAIYVLNGISDVTEDRLNGSRRPIARGDLSVEHAAHACWGLAMAATVLGAFVGQGLLPLVLLYLVLGYLYSAPPFALKGRTMGAATVAGLGGLLTYAAGYTVSGGGVDSPLVIFALAMSGWMGLVGAQAKDLSDVVGDAAVGRRTVAVRWGERPLRRLVAVAALVVGAGFFLLVRNLAPALLYVALTVLTGAAVLAITVLSRLSAGSRTNRRLPYRVFMVTQYAAHLILAASVLAGVTG
jgi:4-hydroxybenzoate polyprenyltransferase